MSYVAAYRRSLDDPGAFWAEAARMIEWDEPPGRHAPGGRWFEGGRLNTCWNAVDRHVVAGHGERRALICHSAMTGEARTLSFRELRDEVARVAGMLAAHGVVRGDRVIVYMPMMPEAVFAMLACARLGAVHSVVFGGFAAPELAKRIDDCRPKLLLTASCGIEPGKIIDYMALVERALSLSRHRPSRCIVLQRPQKHATLQPDRDIDWADAVAGADPAACVSVAATDPLYVLYTSGTTGVPKGIVRDHGGHAVALVWSMRYIYGLEPGEVFWAASDIGWVVGHSYIVYGPLLHGCATVLYEGKPVGTPDAGEFWRVVREHGVDVLFTAPTAIRAIKREDPQGRFIREIGTARLRTLFLAGERADPDTVDWAASRLGVPVIDHWWQTELGWPALATCVGLGEQRVRRGSAGRPVPGFAFRVLDADHRELPRGALGDIVLELPLAPGCLLTLWNNEAGYASSYLEQHPGCYSTGDAGFVDEEGFVHVMGRIDDIINVAGHRLSTGAIEQIVAAHPDVAECAVIGVADSLKGHVPVALIVLKAGVTRANESVIADIVQRVRDELGAVACFRSAIVVERLPKTRSGKILRGTMRRIADGETVEMPPTIEDPATLQRVEAALRQLRPRPGSPPTCEGDSYG